MRAVRGAWSRRVRTGWRVDGWLVTRAASVRRVLADRPVPVRAGSRARGQGGGCAGATRASGHGFTGAVTVAECCGVQSGGSWPLPIRAGR